MNKLILFIALTIVASLKAKSQNIDSAVARNISNKMRDSLSLSQGQANAIFQITKEARIQKKQVWSQYRGMKVLKDKMLLEDNRRDSLIRNVIGDEKYSLYMQKRWQLTLTN